MKRFVETNRWDDPWFHALPPAAKLLWGWITDKCDPSGVIDVSFAIASFQIGLEVSESTLGSLGDRIERLPNGKWRIVKFLQFQYGELSEKCPAHKPVLRAIKSNGIKYPNDTLSDRVQEKDKNKERDGEEGVGGEVKIVVDGPAWAQKIVEAYVRRDAPMECVAVVLDALNSGESPEEMLQSVREISALCRAAPSGVDNAYIPRAKNFFTERQWRSPEAFKRFTQKPHETTRRRDSGDLNGNDRYS